MKARGFDDRFDAGEDVSADVDWSRAPRADTETRRDNADFPAWVISNLDRQAKEPGVTRQAERLQ